MPAGRPRIPIDADEVRRLAAIGCSQAEIAGFFGAKSHSIISERFRQEYDLGVAESKICLRKRQWNASRRSVPMMIHLGKQMLGQSDRVQVEQLQQATIVELPPKDVDDQSTSGPPEQLSGESS